MQNIRIIHVVLDEKFIDCAIEQFNKIDNLHNRYVYFRPVKNIRFKYIKNKTVIESFKTKEELKNILCNSEYDILVLHSLTLSSSILLNIPKRIKVVWLSWGWDIYVDISQKMVSSLPIKLSLYKPKTRKILYSNFNSIIQILVESIYFFYRRKIMYGKMIQRIDYCSTVLPYEEKLLLKNKNYRAKYFHFRYGTSKGEILNPFDLSSKFKGTNILLGNSASPENNHLDIIQLLQRLNINNRKIIVPLSYGDKTYRKIVVSSMKSLEFIPLLDFLPIEEYMNIVTSCSHVVMGHVRQQAIGNVFMALTRGCKLFLYKDSVTYLYLKSCGYYIYTIEDDLNIKELSEDLSDDQIIHNRKLAEDRLSYKKMIDRLEKSIEIVMSNIG